MSERKVTGTALNRILTASKEYIDSKDIWFEELEIDSDTGTIIDPDTGLEVEELDFCQYGNLYAEDIQQTLDRAFSDEDTTK